MPVKYNAGLNGRYSAVLPELEDGDYAPTQVDKFSRLLVSVQQLPEGVATAINQVLGNATLVSAVDLLTALVGKYTSSTSTITISPAITTSSTLLIAANPNRKGLIIYNNSANSIYLAYGSPANSATNMTAILATFTHHVMAQPIYTGAIYAVRNSGSGNALVTQLT